MLASFYYGLAAGTLAGLLIAFAILTRAPRPPRAVVIAPQLPRLAVPAAWRKERR